MKYVKLFEQFLDESVSNDEIKDFVNKFDLIDKDSYDKELKRSINDIIKMFNKGEINKIRSSYPDLQKLIKKANDYYNEELIRLALPQGNMQSSTPKIPKVDIEWGKE